MIQFDRSKQVAVRLDQVPLKYQSRSRNVEARIVDQSSSNLVLRKVRSLADRSDPEAVYLHHTVIGGTILVRVHLTDPAALHSLYRR